MNKCILLVFISICGVLAVAGATPQEETSREPDVKKATTELEFMQLKLDYTREIMAGLTTEDFGRIQKAAQDLMIMSHENDWNVVTTPEYLQASADFREKAGRLRDRSNEKNLDGALLVYFEVTVACVRCHEQIRR